MIPFIINVAAWGTLGYFLGSIGYTAKTPEFWIIAGLVILIQIK